MFLENCCQDRVLADALTKGFPRPVLTGNRQLVSQTDGAVSKYPQPVLPVVLIDRNH